MSDLRLLLVPFEEHGRAVLDGGLRADTAGHARPDDLGNRLDRGHLRSLAHDKNDLSKQGYCIVAPQGARGERLLEVAQPLIDRRTEELNRGLTERSRVQKVQVVRAPTIDQMGREPTWDEAITWVKDHVERPELDERDIPYYRLLLGDLHEIPLSVQQALTVHGLVGRLAFDRDEDYEAYIAKLLAQERGVVPDIWPDLTLYTVRDGTTETTIMHDALVARVHDNLCRDFDLHDWAHQAHQYVVEPASSAHLHDWAKAAQASVLFTLSHGIGTPRQGWLGKQERQRRFQGAMSFGKSDLLHSRDIATGPFLAGGVWFMHACFSAGTPGYSVYQPWLQRLAERGKVNNELVGQVLHSLPTDGGRPFIAELPKVALAKSDGPLGFIGHIDLAWNYGFGDQHDRETGHGKRIGVLQGVLNGLSQGHRFGACFHHLTHYLNATIASEFPAVLQHASGDRLMTNPRYMHLWMMREDLRGYALLGDPAARILAPGRELWRSDPPPVRQVSTVGVPTPPSPPDDAELERAIARIVLGASVAEMASELAGVSEQQLQDWVDRYREAGRGALER